MHATCERRLRYVIEQASAWADVRRPRCPAVPAWAALQASESRIADTILPEHDHDAVRIMTIHAAKGSKFPITIVSGLTTKPQRRRPLASCGRRDMDARRRDGDDGCTTTLKPIDEQMSDAERRRLLYVACTCAIDHLVVSLHRGGDLRPTWVSTPAPSCWYPPVRAIRRPARGVGDDRRAPHRRVGERDRAPVGGRCGVGRRTHEHPRPGVGANDDQRHPVGRGPGRDRGPGRPRPAQGPRRSRPPALATRSLWHGRGSCRARRAPVRRPRTRHRHRPSRRGAMRGGRNPRRLRDGRRPRPLGARGTDRARHSGTLNTTASCSSRPRSTAACVEGYIDLLVRTPDGLVIVDYKTDQWQAAHGDCRGRRSSGTSTSPRRRRDRAGARRAGDRRCADPLSSR